MEQTNSNQYFQEVINEVLEKVRQDPGSITTADARRLSENVVVDDLRTSRIISAVESFANASNTIHEVDPTLGQAPHTSLLTVVNDLKVAVDQNPADVTAEVLRTAQTIVSTMQKAIGQTNAPHPELEAELQEEIAKIEPKVAQGTVTIEEANHLHSLEARAHGHTEKGGITSIAQSVAAKRERKLSLGSNASPTGILSRANSKTITHHEQDNHDKAIDAHEAENATKFQVEKGATNEAKNGGDSATPEQSADEKKREESLSDWTKISHGITNLQLHKAATDKPAELTPEPKAEKTEKPEQVKQEVAA